MKHGRTSEAERSTIVAELYPIPDPPAELDGAEAAVWRSLCEAMPSNWFRPEMFTLLTTLCRETAQLKAIEAELAKFKGRIPTGAKWKRYKELTMLRHSIASQVGILSSKLRMTPQAWIDPQSAGRAVRGSKQRPAIGAKPWGDE